MSFPSRISRIYPSHARVVGHPVYSQHVGRGASVNRMRIGITAKIIKAGNHCFLKSLIDYVFPPKVSHPVLNPFKVRDSDASGVRENVRDHEDPLLMQYLIRRSRGGPIRSFREDLTFDLVGVLR